MDVSFGICTYNAEDYILDALESIRYQIENYGEGHKVYLAISDDASTDHTTELVQKWFDRYKDLFAGGCQLIISDVNRGISHNFVALMKHIHTEYFKMFSGDDIISSHNIFDQIEKADPECMTFFFPIHFTEEGTYVTDRDLCNMFFYERHKHIHKKDLWLIEARKPFPSPEICIRRKYYSDGCFEFVEHFTMFEDDPSYYYILKNNEDMVLKICSDPMILYRKHSKSLSQGSVDTTSQIRFLDDLHKFRKYVMLKEKNIFVKCFLFLSVLVTFRMKHRFGMKSAWYWKVDNYLFRRREKYALKSADWESYVDNMKRMAEAENEHLLMIRERALKFRSEIGI